MFQFTQEMNSNNAKTRRKGLRDCTRKRRYFGYVYSTMELSIAVNALELNMKELNNVRWEETKQKCYFY